ncbi:MAG: hypothetical protein AABX48_01285 [Nanoarchaeota archaeon]
MDKKSWIIVFLFLIIVVGVVFYFYNYPNSVSQDSECVKLAKSFDIVANEVGNYFYYKDKIIGGTLIKIDNQGFDDSHRTYNFVLLFKGDSQEKPLFLISGVSDNIPYKEGQFYEFDLKNVRTSGYNSGSFIDDNFDKLIPISCS